MGYSFSFWEQRVLSQSNQQGLSFFQQTRRDVELWAIRALSPSPQKAECASSAATSIQMKNAEHKTNEMDKL